MSLVAYQYHAANLSTGAALAGATVTIYLAGTTTLATLYSLSGGALSNPLTADSNGNCVFQNDNGSFYEIVTALGGYVTPRLQQLEIAALATLATAQAANAAAIVSETARAEAAEGSIAATAASAVASEVTRAEAAEAANGLNISLEESRAIGAEGVLTTSVSALQPPVYRRQPSRPGDAAANFTNTITGDPISLSSPPPTSSVATLGNVGVITGNGVLASRGAWRLEPGRQYLVRFVTERLQDTLNPSGASVECCISWMIAGFTALGGTPTTIANTLTQWVSSGRVEFDVIISTAAATLVNIVAPSGAIYFRPFVQTFNSDTVTAVELIDVQDVTNVTAYSPDLTSLTSQVTALTSANLPTRVTTLEGEVSAPTVYRTSTVAAAQAITIPSTSNYLETNAWGASYPTIRTLWERVSSQPSHSAWFQDASNAYWSIAESLIDPVALGAMGNASVLDDTPVAKALSVGRPVYCGFGRVYLVATFNNSGGVAIVGPGSIQLQYSDNVGTVSKQVAPFYSDAWGPGRFAEFAIKRLWDYMVLGSTVVLDLRGDSTAVGYGVSVVPSSIISDNFTKSGYGNVISNNNAVSGSQWGDLFASSYGSQFDSPVTVTFTAGSPGVVNWASHGLVVGDMVRFSTTGALLSPLIAASTNNFVNVSSAACYYVSNVVDSGHFNVSATLGGSSLAFSGSQTGTQGAIGYHIPSSLSGTAVLICKFFINDAAQDYISGDGSDVAIAISLMRTKLQWIRASYSVGNLGILVVGPNADNDNRNWRDARWNEQIRPGILQACRDLQCAFFDTYGFLQNLSPVYGTLNDDVSPGSLRGVHPTQNADYWIWGGVVDFLLGRNNLNQVRQNNLVNAGGGFSSINPGNNPSNFSYGISIFRATAANGWPEDGACVNVRNVDAVSMQMLFPYASGRTRCLTRTANVSSNTWNRWTGVYENITLSNSWVNYGGGFATPQAAISAEGVVTVKGVIQSGTYTTGTVVGTLPVGMWPAEDHLVMANCYGSPGLMRIHAADGTLTVNTTWPTNAVVSIDCSFSAA